MENKILTLGTIRDEILEYYPELLWWDGFHEHEVWNKNHSFKHRQGMPNEIRIEFDSEDISKNWENINFTAINLWDLGYSFAIFFVEGGRSPHIHIYDVDELEQLDLEQREEYRKRFLMKICPKGSNPDLNLCRETHLCALEFATHFKYNKPKQILNYFWDGLNGGIDLGIKLDILQRKSKGSKKSSDQKKLKFGDMLVASGVKRLIGKLTFEQIFDKYKVEYKGRMALCPFHADGNDSLSFSNEKGLWKCWGAGCEAKGDMITLIKMLKEVKDGNKN